MFLELPYDIFHCIYMIGVRSLKGDLTTYKCQEKVGYNYESNGI